MPWVWVLGLKKKRSFKEHFGGNWDKFEHVLYTYQTILSHVSKFLGCDHCIMIMYEMSLCFKGDML